MDEQLIALARAVKRRHRCPHPTLWLFTDRARLGDPLAAIARLPPGIGGVVLRDDDAPDRAALAAGIAALCRRRRLALVVAGDWRLAAKLGAGVHVREGAKTPRRRWRLVTASAHGRAGLVRATRLAARRGGADLVFLSPAFPTASHPGAPALGPVRWAALARAVPGRVLALGGIAGRRQRALGAACRGAGAIGALSDQRHTVWPSYHSAAK